RPSAGARWCASATIGSTACRSGRRWRATLASTPRANSCAWHAAPGSSSAPRPDPPRPTAYRGPAGRIMDGGRRLQEWLRALGFDGDEEMESTGQRVAEFLRAFVPTGEPPELSACASRPGNGEVQIREIPFYSLCAHHLLPFFGTVSIAYRPGPRL